MDTNKHEFLRKNLPDYWCQFVFIRGLKFSLQNNKNLQISSTKDTKKYQKNIIFFLCVLLVLRG